MKSRIILTPPRKMRVTDYLSILALQHCGWGVEFENPPTTLMIEPDQKPTGQTKTAKPTKH